MLLCFIIYLCDKFLPRRKWSQQPIPRLVWSCLSSVPTSWLTRPPEKLLATSDSIILTVPSLSVHQLNRNYPSTYRDEDHCDFSLEHYKHNPINHRGHCPWDQDIVGLTPTNLPFFTSRTSYLSTFTLIVNPRSSSIPLLDLPFRRTYKGSKLNTFLSTFWLLSLSSCGSLSNMGPFSFVRVHYYPFVLETSVHREPVRVVVTSDIYIVGPSENRHTQSFGLKFPPTKSISYVLYIHPTTTVTKSLSRYDRGSRD